MLSKIIQVKSVPQCWVTLCAPSGSFKSQRPPSMLGEMIQVTSLLQCWVARYLAIWTNFRIVDFWHLSNSQICFLSLVHWTKGPKELAISNRLSEADSKSPEVFFIACLKTCYPVIWNLIGAAPAKILEDSWNQSNKLLSSHEEHQK